MLNKSSFQFYGYVFEKSVRQTSAIGEHRDLLIDISFTWFNITTVIYAVIYKWFNPGLNALFPLVRLGLDHDGGSANCPNYQYIMSTSVPGGIKAGMWSPCSRQRIQALLR